MQAAASAALAALQRRGVTTTGGAEAVVGSKRTRQRGGMQAGKRRKGHAAAAAAGQQDKGGHTAAHEEQDACDGSDSESSDREARSTDCWSPQLCRMHPTASMTAALKRMRTCPCHQGLPSSSDSPYSAWRGNTALLCLKRHIGHALLPLPRSVTPALPDRTWTGTRTLQPASWHTALTARSC